MAYDALGESASRHLRSLLDVRVDRPTLIYWGSLLLGLVLAVLIFRACKSTLRVDIAAHASLAWLTAGVFGVAASGLWLSARDLSSGAVIFYRTSSLLIGTYLFFGSVPLPPGTSEATTTWFTCVPWLAIVAALLSIWRPTLALIPFGLLFIVKGVTGQAWAVGVTPTDWAPIVESTSFLLMSSCAVFALCRIATWATAEPAVAIEHGRLKLSDALMVVAIGIHFANYFWSGMEKLTLDGGPLTWLLENRTDVLVDVALESGFFTLAYGLPFSNLVHTLAGDLVLPINAITLGAQLACIFVFWRRSWIVALTLVYDLQHISIFLLTGIFFWKWIIFNLALVAAVSRIDRNNIPLPVGVLGLIACLFGGQLFFIANLGWYDSRAFNHFHVLAVLDDGREVPVPSNFFGPLSVTMAQMDAAPEWPDGFRTGTWGSTSHYATKVAGMQCRLVADSPALAGNESPAVTLLVRQWHALMLARVAAGRQISYDVYPHHIWSDPRRFSEFANLDLRQIAAYRLLRESKCLDGRAEFGGPRLIATRGSLVPVKATYAGSENPPTTGSLPSR